jgi:hypothetical protein
MFPNHYQYGIYVILLSDDAMSPNWHTFENLKLFFSTGKRGRRIMGKGQSGQSSWVIGRISMPGAALGEFVIPACQG